MRIHVFLFLLAAAVPLTSLPAQRAVTARAVIPVRILSRFPCPARIPGSWFVADSTLAHKPRCALVAAAVYAFHRSAERDARLREVSLSKVTCTRVQRITLRDPHSESVVSDNWLVAFYSDGQPDVAVSIDPRTGDGRAFISAREFDYSARQLCAQAT